VYTAEARKAAINLGDKTVEAVMQDIQFHPVTDKILHIDFIQLVDGKPVTIEVPLMLTGNARGVRNGGKLKHTLRKLSIRAVPANLPDSISLDITNLRIGQSVRVNEVPGDGFEILNPGSAVVCSIKMARGAVAEADETEEGAEAAS
jgi:large subunit ribosomal protein L25